jgi:hypothetical protein
MSGFAVILFSWREERRSLHFFFLSSAGGSRKDRSEFVYSPKRPNVGPNGWVKPESAFTKSLGGGVGGGGGPSCRFRSIHSQTHCGSRPCRNREPKLPAFARRWGGDRAGVCPCVPRPSKGLGGWGGPFGARRGMRGRAGKGQGRGRKGQGRGREGAGKGRAGKGRADVVHRTIATKFRQGTAGESSTSSSGPVGNLGAMARVFHSSKTTIGKTKQPCPVILKEVPRKGMKPVVVGRLPVRERKMLLAIARVLAGK